MKIRTLLLLILIGIIAAFVVVNWGEFIKPTTISIWYQTIEAPLGLILLGLLIILTAIFWIYTLSLRASLLLKERNLTKELKKAQEIADKAESSRFTELKNLLEEEFQKIRENNSENLEKIMNKIQELSDNQKKQNG